ATPGMALLEVGPGRTLQSFARKHPEGRRAVVAASLPEADRPEADALLAALGRLWVAGGEPDWEGFHAGARRRRGGLPPHPFERRRFWIAPAPSGPALGPALPAPLAEVPPAEPDRQARPEIAVPFAPPEGAAEERIAAVWRRRLGLAEIGRDDSFFDLGGDSLQ